MFTIRINRIVFVIWLVFMYLWPNCLCVSAADPNLSDRTKTQDVGNPYEARKEEIANSEIVIRIYENWRNFDDSYSIKKWPVVLSPLDGISLKESGVTPDSLYLISGLDQTDNFLRELLGSFVFTGISDETQMGLEPFLRGQSPRGTVTINDAVGVPMADARVRLYLANHDNNIMIELCDVKLDSKGQMLNPGCTGDHLRMVISVSHPDWADGFEAVVQYYGDMHQRYAPLVRNDNEHADREIWGNILDPNGVPVGGARIQNTLVRSISGSHIKTQTCTIYSDADGRYYYYPIVQKSNLGSEVPYDSKYHVEISAPAKYDLTEYRGNIANGRETNIVFERGDVFKTLVFTDANGPITDLKKLSRIKLNFVNKKGNYEPVDFDRWKDGTYLRYGEHIAKGYWGRESFDFETMYVSKDSPGELVFVPEKPYENIPENIVTYQGRVVDGLTGAGLADVFVVTADWSKRDFADINDLEWTAIENAGENLKGDDDELLPFREKWSYYNGPPEPYIGPFKVLVRSDEQGYFSFSWFKKDHIEFVVAFARGYLTDKRLIDSTSRRAKYLPDENNMIYLPDMRMYRSGILKFTPVVDIPKLDLRIRPDFRVTDDVSWSGDFINWYKGHRFCLAERNLRKVEPIEMLVPAEIDFRLWLKIADHSRTGDPWWCDRYTDYFRVETGGTLDLNEVKIDSEIPVFVKVLDSAGNPVDSVTVSHLRFETHHSLGLSHITDSNGLAMFYVPPIYKGRFSVCVRSKDPQTAESTIIQQDITYETAGSDSANRVFELVLSDDMLEILYGAQFTL